MEKMISFHFLSWVGYFTQQNAVFEALFFLDLLFDRDHF